MVSITLGERDAAVLDRLREGNADVETLAARTACDPGFLRERLPELADNGLVQRVDGDVYGLTDSGKRAITGSPAGTMDDRIDTPAEVEREIAAFDLRPDREAAVRNSFAFLKYWGEAYEVEIVDAAYTEHPAGFVSSEAWWDECVREYLADLPRVESPDSPDEPWRYAGTPTVEKVTEDGRTAPDDDVRPKSSVKFALERADLSEAETSAVRAAFALLFRRGEASATELRDEVYPDHDAGYGDASEWWTGFVREALESLPGVERVGEGDGERVDDAEDVWRYHQTDE